MKGFDEVFFRKFVGSAFDHDDLVFAADVDVVEVAFLAFGVGGVDDELSVNAADADSAHGFGKGDVGDDEGGGCAVDAEDVRIVFAVCREEDGDDLGVIEVTLREHGAKGAVRHAAGEDFLFGGTSFAFEVAAGEHARSCRFFLVFDGEREECLSVLDFGGADGGDEDDGVSATYGDGSVGKACHFAGFNGDGVCADGAFDGMNTHCILVSSCMGRGFTIKSRPVRLPLMA